MKSSRTIRVLAAAASLACAAFMSTAAPASADDAPAGKSLVTIGDSYSTNGNIIYSLGFGYGGDTSCQRSETSWPKQLQHKMNLADNDVEDVACLGASLATPPHYTAEFMAKQAATAGAFGPRTKLVTIQLGQNDIWNSPFPQRALDAEVTCLTNFIQGCGPDAGVTGRAPDARGVSGSQYVNWIKPVVDYVKYYAPQAKIAIVGYPTIAERGNPQWCWDSPVGRITQPAAGAMTEFLDKVDDAQRAAASTLGVNFFDTRAATTGHGTCSPDSWINGYFVPTGEFLGIPFHPTIHGDDVVSGGIKAQFGL
ncbi:SGNH/GDSL hydrolase family protein [Antrihabitans cavernicola]|uniref:SGNH/GDSL hydrolase family protein n=1 Tax=Antrihabitans cavernicola TaxID=2495913 RepID=A0A5A7S8C6_9NOCA|nr:SGNH/GDSL hydrolase family protein [Spelaeibacter cavernicola]KAA0020134.1 SGNH/GDSL hydrolase family protein [Spelaeibacter cavernicola]